MRGVSRLAALAAAVALVGGCAAHSSGTPARGSSPIPSPTPAAIDEVRAAFRALTGTPYKFDVLLQGRGAAVRGSFDNARTSFTMQVYAGQLVGVEHIAIGTDFYLKDTVSERPEAKWPKNKWMHINGARAVKYDPLLGGYEGNTGYGGYADAFVTAERTGTGAYQGTLNLHQLNVKAEFLDRYPDGGRAVPFTATVDANHVAKSVEFEAYQEGRTEKGKETVTISAVGVPLTIAPPPAKDTIEAPDSVYKAYGG